MLSIYIEVPLEPTSSTGLCTHYMSERNNGIYTGHIDRDDNSSVLKPEAIDGANPHTTVIYTKRARKANAPRDLRHCQSLQTTADQLSTGYTQYLLQQQTKRTVKRIVSTTAQLMHNSISNHI